MQICNICENNSIKYLFTSSDIEQKTAIGEFKYFQCDKCKTISINPIPKMDEIISFYNKEYNIYNQYIAPSPRKLFIKNSFFYKFLLGTKHSNIAIELIKNIESNSPIVVEYGCGNAQLLQYLELATNIKIKGYDFSQLAVDIALSHKLNVKQVSDLNQIDEKNIDLLIAFQLLEHLPSPKKFIITASRKIKKDGLLFLALPNYNSLGRILFNKNWKGMDIPRHLYQFNTNSITYLLENNGFRIKYIKTNTLYISSLKLLQGKLLRDKHWTDNKIVKILLRDWFGKFLGLFGKGDNMLVVAQKI